MPYKTNSYNSETKTDAELLKKLIKDHNGILCRYYIPQTPKYIKICKFIFEQHGIKPEVFKSSMYPYPVLKITATDMVQLDTEPMNFLNSIIVYSDELSNRLQQVRFLMDQKKSR